jgi:GT2 family glycosyltransferase
MKMAFDEGADVVVVANADIRFGPGSLAQLVKTADAYKKERPITFCSGHHGKNGKGHSFGHSLFAVTKSFTERVGYFDQNFKKAYYEDSDMDRRRDRAGVLSADAGILDVYHEGSESIFLADPEEEKAIRDQQERNARYYHQKWGASEEYPCPFNLELPPWLPNRNWGPDLQEILQRIPWERREDPYPGYGIPDPPAVGL